MTSAELWEKRYHAVFNLMQNLADAGRILLDNFECETSDGENPTWMIVLGRMDPEDVEYAIKKLVRHTKEVNNRYGDPDPDGINLNEGDKT